jgi:hypothetical protein
VDFTQRVTDRIPAYKADGGDTCSRVNSLLKHSFARYYILIGSKWYDVSRILPIGDGWVRIYVRDAGYDEEFYFTERWNHPYLSYLAGNFQEYLDGSRSTGPLQLYGTSNG